ncbi:MAG: sulfur carrier protein ThiS [Clostridiaceae bacterium]|nr:sulfur carrier protein ThiS [Clostridiaceae bacterium]
MEITACGKQVSCREGISLQKWLEENGYVIGRIAVERNGEIVSKEQYADCILLEQDELEVVEFMGGGASGLPDESKDCLVLGGHTFESRFILGSGKYSLDLIKAAVNQAGAQIITLALRRANQGGMANILDYIPDGVTLLPNTSGARNADEAVRIAKLAREVGCGDFVKIEIMRDSKYLLPDNAETVKATELLVKEGFVVMPYMYPDLNVARDLKDAGAACIMPLGAPIGSNKGLCTKEFIQILIDEIDLPIIVDAGIGCPSQACEAMEMGAAAVMANTAVATAGDIPQMADAFRLAIQAGRKAYLSGLGRVLEKGGSASSPLTGFLRQ